MYISNFDVLIKTNNKVAGKFKQEFESVVIDEFIGLLSKPYSLKHYKAKRKE